MSYAPLYNSSSDPVELSRWVNTELQRIADELAMLRLVEYTEAPDKPWHGLRVIADGTTWNPGSGRGVYWYDASDASWNFMG